MKGSGYTQTDKEGHTITSIDGYRAYLIIVDRHSRFTWVFLTKSKAPPVEIVTTFLKQHGQQSLQHKTIRTDKGGKLWNCQAFRQCVLQAGYLLEPTAAGAPSQNGLAERPNLTLSVMVRCLLHSTAFGPEFWSFALLHAVYLKNHLPHASTGITPYLRYTGKRPSARELRIFGCHIIAKQPGKRPTKLDSHTCTGRFLGYMATDKNMYYRDDQTHRIKITTYCTFDEGGMTVPPAEQPPSAKALQQHGYQSQPTTEPTTDTPQQTDAQEDLTIKLLTPQAKVPTRASDAAAGYDVYSPTTAEIPPGQRALIPLDIAATPPPGTYLQVASRSGLAAKHMVDTKASVIDANYTGNITVVLHNSGTTAYKVEKGDRIAQLLVLPVQHPTIKVANDLQDTTRASQGFGSTGRDAIIRTCTQSLDPPQTPYDIYLSLDPFDNVQHIDIPVKGDHPTLGLNLTPCVYRNRLRLIDMFAGTPGSCLPK